MNVDHRVRELLILSRQLLTKLDIKDPATPDQAGSLNDLIVSYEAAELALTAICVQLHCLPRKKDIFLPDYLDSLRSTAQFAAIVQEMDYAAELQKVRSDSQLQFLLPDSPRWARAQEETLEHVATWCEQYLGLHLSDLDSLPTGLAAAPAASCEPLAWRGQLSLSAPYDPLRRRYDCVGSADIRLFHRERSEKGSIANLSSGGCYVNTEFVFDVGEQIEMILQVNRMSFRAVGNVAHVPPRSASDKGEVTSSGMGVQFMNMTAGARSRLQELVTELKANRIFGFIQRRNGS
jgi:Tfp pilus assembly protein PilZ